MEDRRRTGRRIPEPLVGAGRPHRGVQGRVPAPFREGLPEPGLHRARGLQHPGVSVPHGRLRVRPQFRRGLPARVRDSTLQAHTRVRRRIELQRLSLDPDPDDDSTWIHVVRANQYFTQDLYLQLFFQTNSAIDRRNVQAVFVYRYKPPFGTLQAAFQRGTAGFGERSEQGNTLFLKGTLMF